MGFFIYLFPHVHQLFLHFCCRRLLLYFFVCSSAVWVAMYLCVIKITLHVGAHDHSESATYTAVEGTSGVEGELPCTRFPGDSYQEHIEDK